MSCNPSFDFPTPWFKPILSFHLTPGPGSVTRPEINPPVQAAKASGVRIRHPVKTPSDLVSSGDTKIYRHRRIFLEHQSKITCAAFRLVSFTESFAVNLKSGSLSSRCPRLTMFEESMSCARGLECCANTPSWI